MYISGLRAIFDKNTHRYIQRDRIKQEKQVHNEK